jgi:glutaredoxin-related protein
MRKKIPTWQKKPTIPQVWQKLHFLKRVRLKRVRLKRVRLQRVRLKMPKRMYRLRR